MSDARRLNVGAERHDDGATDFRVWAPDHSALTLVLGTPEPDAHVPSRTIAMTAGGDGYFRARVPDALAGQRYGYRLGSSASAERQADGVLPDPASRWQPEGVFGLSELVDPGSYPWQDAGWRGVRLPGQVICELHIGTFTREGTWGAAAARLPQLAEVGITLLEVMPVSTFPGRFGWGYDGVFPFAPTPQYGTPDDMRAFVDRAHALGLGVMLDVVYNHLGPEGCVFKRYARDYYSTRYEGEWGDPLNFDGPGSGPVRAYVEANAAYWIREFHLDGLRIDATQGMHDASPEHGLTGIARAARDAAGDRDIVLVAENEPQHTRLVRPTRDGGYGLDALWNDDFHHSAMVAATGRSEAYYSDHAGRPQEFISSARHGYLFQGQRYAWQGKGRGTSTRGIPPQCFVNFLENHDQLANSGDGSRVRLRTSPAMYRALTALLLLLPGTPMLFQGQEFGASGCFLYFADLSPGLAEEVRRGRARFVSQFPSLAADAMQACLPAPHDPSTFEASRVRWEDRTAGNPWLRLHRDLLTLRRADGVFDGNAGVDGAVLSEQAWVLRFPAADPALDRLLLINLGHDLVAGSFPEPLVAPPEGHEWEIRWSSEAPDYGGGGTPDVVGLDGWRVPACSATVLSPTTARTAADTTRVVEEHGDQEDGHTGEDADDAEDAGETAA